MNHGANPETPKRPSGRGFRVGLPGAAALRSRDYRLYFFGYVTEVSGQQMLWVAQFWLIYELSGSAILLGAAGLARAAPATILAFIGGALADKLDQRRLLMGVQFVQMSLLLTLATLTLTEQVQVWHLFVVVSASAAMQSFENPARQAIFPRLIPRTALMDAVALNSTIHPGTRFVGPALAGFLMAQVNAMTGLPLMGAAVLFYITASGYVANACFLYLIRLPAIEGRSQKTSMLTDMKMGVRFILRNRIFASLIAMTYCSHFFGWSFQSLFPVFAKDVFGGGEFELGLMYSAVGGGSLLGAAVVSNLAAMRRRGLLIIGGFLAEGFMLVLLGFTSVFSLALGVLFLAGLSQSVFNVSAQSTLQYLVPNEFRGRVMGIWGMTYSSVQPMGQLQMGGIAGAFSAPVAVIFGGTAMIVFALSLALPNGRLRNLTPTSESRAAEQALAAGGG